MAQSVHLQKGSSAEQQAERYLSEAGLKLIKRNFSSRFGEVDLILSDNKSLIFVEVRYRSNSSFGGALASVTQTKQKKIIKTAEYFLQTHKQFHKYFLRFDVIGIDAENNIDWIKGAFLVTE